jgi:hypothetical protein
VFARTRSCPCRAQRPCLLVRLPEPHLTLTSHMRLPCSSARRRAHVSVGPSCGLSTNALGAHRTTRTALPSRNPIPSHRASAMPSMRAHTQPRLRPRRVHAILASLPLNLCSCPSSPQPRHGLAMHVPACANPVERGGVEAREQAPGACGEDVVVPVGPSGVGVHTPDRGEHSDPGGSVTAKEKSAGSASASSPDSMRRRQRRCGGRGPGSPTAPP